MSMLINGQLSNSVEADDRGLAYGDGLFETIEICQGRFVFWQHHIKRLVGGCRRLSIPEPDPIQLHDEASQLLEPKSDGVLKIIISRGSGGRGYRIPDRPCPTRVISLHPKPDYPAEHQNRGVSLGVCAARLAINPQLAGLKHLNRLEQVLARTELNESKHHEGLMLDYEGHPVEGIMSNLFWVSKGELFTPDLSFCGIAGVIRSIIINLAQKNGIPCNVGRFTMEQLLLADEIFMTNSLIGIWPVRRLNRQPFLPGILTPKMINLLNDERKRNLEVAK